MGKRLGGLFEAFNLDPGRKKKLLLGEKVAFEFPA